MRYTMIRSCKTLSISCLLLFSFIPFLSGCEQADADRGIQSDNVKAEITAKDQAVIDSYKRVCARLQIGLDNLDADLQDISAIELKENTRSRNGSLLSVKLADISRGLSVSCNNNENLDVSLNELATAVANFERALNRILTIQPDKTSVDRRLTDGYHEVARKLSRLTDDMKKLLSIAPDYKTIVDATK